jgi:polar amino acid transport system substrate-binding protein
MPCRSLWVLISLSLAAPLLAADAWDHVQKSGQLQWGADATGGAPYIFPDVNHPETLIGFEVELLAAIGKRLGVKPVFVQTPWEELVPALQRKNVDCIFNGLEVTPEREATIDFTRPYYFFSEQLTVRSGETGLRTLPDLHGHRVGTLAASLAYNILAKDPAIHTVPYPSPVEAYKDLELKRTDAVLMDVPIAAWYAGSNPKLVNLPETVGEGVYAGGVRKDSPLLREKLNEAIGALSKSGELERVYRKWGMWTKRQEKLRQVPSSLPSPGLTPGEGAQWTRFIPLLIKGAGMTVLISTLSMALAVLLGFGFCYAKLYGNGFMRGISNIYIEVIRGTPLLIQLYLLYYGLPNLGIHLNAFVAAVLGMGMNYAAYEAEIYRAGLLAVPKGQTDAARSIGMTHHQSLWYILLPQALRTILPPSTNDFIALFKDTSLVSVITVTELTRVYSTAATTTYRFLELGLVTAALYFLMSYPLSLWAKALERKRHATLH